MKSILGGAAALLLSLPAAAAAQGDSAKPVQIDDLSRCAAIYSVMSDLGEEGSEAAALTSFRFLQFYVLMAYIAETDAADAISADSIKASLAADTAKAKAAVDTALASGHKGALFEPETAVCDTIRSQNADIFALVDTKIEELRKED